MRSRINLRIISQIAVVGIVLFLTVSHLRYGIEKAAPIDTYCPFGAIEGFLTYLFTGEYLKRIYASSFILMGILLVSTLVFGRVFCSHFCPLGAIQEWMRSLGRKMGGKTYFLASVYAIHLHGGSAALLPENERIFHLYKGLGRFWYKTGSPYVWAYSKAFLGACIIGLGKIFGRK